MSITVHHRASPCITVRHFEFPLRHFDVTLRHFASLWCAPLSQPHPNRARYKSSALLFCQYWFGIITCQLSLRLVVYHPPAIHIPVFLPSSAYSAHDRRIISRIVHLFQDCYSVFARWVYCCHHLKTPGHCFWPLYRIRPVQLCASFCPFGLGKLGKQAQNHGHASFVLVDIFG